VLNTFGRIGGVGKKHIKMAFELVRREGKVVAIK